MNCGMCGGNLEGDNVTYKGSIICLDCEGKVRKG